LKKINLFSKSKSSKQTNVNDIENVSKSDIDNYVSKELNKTKNNDAPNVDEYVENTLLPKGDDFFTAVNSPSHYQGIVIKGKNGSMEFEAIEIIDSVLDQLNLPPAVSHAVGDALKYQLRCGKKESDNNTTTDLLNKAAQDLRKGGWYLTRSSDLLLEFAKGSSV
jgi:hypothetical protein